MSALVDCGIATAALELNRLHPAGVVQQHARQHPPLRALPRIGFRE
ncbi:hypothetical protein [Paraburkholderia kururiensis]|nr:hypothetical protein [Paraburkholderia kururiensis]